MRFDVITLFPELFGPHLALGVTRRAFEGGQVDVRLWPLRDFADTAYRRVDDRPYGGGPGMVMLAEPLAHLVAGGLSDELVDVTATPEIVIGGKKAKLATSHPAGSYKLEGGDRLVITEGTVKSHVKHILRKYGAVNRSQAIAWALKDR